MKEEPLKGKKKGLVWIKKERFWYIKCAGGKYNSSLIVEVEDGQI